MKYVYYTVAPVLFLPLAVIWIAACFLRLPILAAGIYAEYRGDEDAADKLYAIATWPVNLS